MEPITTTTAILLGPAISSAFNSVSNVINGSLSRRQNAQFQAQNREDADRRHAENRSDADRRFGQDLSLRTAQFLFSQQEAEAAVIRRQFERMEDYMRQEARDEKGRTFTGLNRGLLVSPDSWYDRDPYAHANPGVKSLRLILQRPKGLDEQFYHDIEREIISAVNEYEECGGGHPIHFPTGIWVDGAQQGSWVSTALYSWNSATPSLVLRINKMGENEFFAHCDLFGFPMGDGAYRENIQIGRLPNDPNAIASVLSLVALAASDMYFLSNYARRPLLPRILSRFMPQDGNEGTTKVIDGMVEAYLKTVNSLLKQVKGPEGLYVALELVESLSELPNKQHAAEQLKVIEAMTADVLPQFDELKQRLQALYTKIGMPEEGDRIAKLTQPEAPKQLPDAQGGSGFNALEQHL